MSTLLSNVAGLVRLATATATRDWQSRWWLLLSTGALCGRRAISVSVVVSDILLITIIDIIVHGGQVQGAGGASNRLFVTNINRFQFENKL